MTGQWLEWCGWGSALLIVDWIVLSRSQSQGSNGFLIGCLGVFATTLGIGLIEAYEKPLQRAGGCFFLIEGVRRADYW